MRAHGILSAVAGLALAPMSAFATIYDFQSTETSAIGNPTFTFALDTSTATAASGVTSFSGVSIDESGMPVANNTVAFVSLDEIASPLFFLIDTDVPGPRDFASGSGADIIFNAGTYVIADGFIDGEGTLTISKASASSAPEPKTWWLMLAGVAGIGLMLRRANQRQGLATIRRRGRRFCGPIPL